MTSQRQPWEARPRITSRPVEVAGSKLAKAVTFKEICLESICCGLLLKICFLTSYKMENENPKVGFYCTLVNPWRLCDPTCRLWASCLRSHESHYMSLANAWTQGFVSCSVWTWRACGRVRHAIFLVCLNPKKNGAEKGEQAVGSNKRTFHLFSRPLASYLGLFEAHEIRTGHKQWDRWRNHKQRKVHILALRSGNWFVSSENGHLQNIIPLSTDLQAASKVTLASRCLRHQFSQRKKPDDRLGKFLQLHTLRLCFDLGRNRRP